MLDLILTRKGEKFEYVACVETCGSVRQGKRTEPRAARRPGMRWRCDPEEGIGTELPSTASDIEREGKMKEKAMKYMGNGEQRMKRETTLKNGKKDKE
jgi:hypothetical protein